MPTFKKWERERKVLEQKEKSKKCGNKERNQKQRKKIDGTKIQKIKRKQYRYRPVSMWVFKMSLRIYLVKVFIIYIATSAKDIPLFTYKLSQPWRAGLEGAHSLDCAS